MAGQQRYRQEAAAALMNPPLTPRAGGVPQAQNAGAALLGAAARGGAKVLEVLARDHVREQQGLIDDAVLQAQAAFMQWREDYGRTHQGRDALSAQRDYADAFAKISGDALANFGGGDGLFRGELKRRLATQGLYAVRDGGLYQRQHDELWQKSQLESQLTQFERTVRDNPDDMERIDMEMEALHQSWLTKNPGMDDGAFLLKTRRLRDTARVESLIAAGRFDEAERLLGGPDAAGGVFKGQLPADMKALADSAAREAGVDPALVGAVMAVESGGRADAVSKAGARGVMQLMPDTAKALGVNPDDAADNARGGAKYLGQMLERYGGNLEHALMAYNWGPSNVDAWLKAGKGLNGRDVPVETRKYVAAVTGKLEKPDAPVQGMVEPGNIDLFKRPVVKNADGSISTVRSMSFNFDGKEVLIPTVGDDGRLLSPEEAVTLYQKTGKHLGVFDTPNHASAYAQTLHEDQDRLYSSRNGQTGNGLPGLTAADRMRISNAVRTGREREREEKLITRAQAWLDETKGLDAAERESILRDRVATLSDIKDRAGMDALLSRELNAERERKKAGDNRQARVFVEAARSERLRPTEVLRRLNADDAMSDEAKALAWEKFQGKIEENASNRAALTQVRRKLDQRKRDGVPMTDDEIEAWGLDNRCTDAQIDAAFRHRDDGGKTSGVTIARLEQLWKKLGGRKAPDGLYDVVVNRLPDGKKPSEEDLIRLMSNLLMSGEAQGGGFGYGSDMTLYEAISQKRDDAWLPDLPRGEGKRRAEAFLVRKGWPVNDRTVRVYAKVEQGIPHGEIRTLADWPQNSPREPQ